MEHFWYNPRKGVKAVLWELLRERILIFDGAMGTRLQQLGLPPGYPPEEWNLSHPEEVLKVHKSYVESGADVIQTNTFGGNRVRLARSGLDGCLVDILREGVRIARRALRPGVLLAASLGPLGEFMEPFGDLTEEKAREAFREAVQLLSEMGIRLFHLETFSSSREALLALEAVEAVGGEAIVSFTFESRGGKMVTLLGETPESIARLFWGKAGVVLGANCGTGIREALAIFEEYQKVYPGPFSAKPNAGVPSLQGGEVTYHETPEDFLSLAPRFFELGVRIIGGCCGTHEGHIAALKRARDLWSSQREG
ncbi:homocysteine S-methyltransferase family protein [Candidatus Caldatribacterium sp.]|uniref:homocysteine S-methyltransferase family protein n=1 Tax=Candidatus Caldatribacterium sp. TaxID=2282143 RepID=UPI002994E2C8|nr:homocysteine S-methyltransferase family protein [Candidatus Calescibacterium sp.]